MANKSDAIKIACDYISLQNLSITHQLVSESREYRLTSQTGEDVLSLYDTLYHMYCSLPGLSELAMTQQNLPTSDHPNPASSPEHQKKKRHNELLAPRAAGRDRKFCCPLCPEERVFNRNGLLQHL